MIKQLNDRTETSPPSVSIELEFTGIDELVQYQKSLIELIKQYNYDEHGNYAGTTMYYAICLLENLLPNQDQQEKGFTPDEPQFKIPENINTEQRQAVIELLHCLKYPKSNDFNKSKIIKTLLND